MTEYNAMTITLETVSGTAGLTDKQLAYDFSEAFKAVISKVNENMERDQFKDSEIISHQVTKFDQRYVVSFLTKKD